MEDQRLNHNLQRTMKRISNKTNKTYVKKSTKGGSDAFYGSNTRRDADMDETNYQLEKQKFLEDLDERQSRRILIERQTVAQRDSNLWKTYRHGLVTASVFGRVCCARSPASYTNIVNDILYSKLDHLGQIQHGIAYEDHAIKALEALENIVVKPCGFSIDSKYSFMGATPDGLVGDNAIAEVKCPSSIFGQNIDEALLAGKLIVWSRERKQKRDPTKIPKILGINKRHKWYFQVQGQLHITGRDMCYFVVWAGDNIPIRLEKIYRDDEFWHNQMENQIKRFFDTALLPELVDSRHGRTMPLRKYDASGNMIS